MSKVIEEALCIKRKDPLVKPLKEVNLGAFLVKEMSHKDRNIRLYASACITFAYAKTDEQKPANNRYYKTFMTQLHSAAE